MFELKTHCCEEFIVSGSSLEQALKVAKRDGISLAYADLTGYWLMRIGLSGMDLRGADFSGSVFDQSNFQGADLTDAIVSETTFHDCDMRGVNRTGVGFDTDALRGADIEGMYSDFDAEPVAARSSDFLRLEAEEWLARMRSRRNPCRDILLTPGDASVERVRNAFLSEQSYASYLNVFGTGGE